MLVNYFNEKGFTLTELLVVLAIIGVISGISLSSFGNGTRHLDLRNAARQTADLYRTAQSYATNVRSSANDDSFTGRFGVYIDMSQPTEIILYADSETDGNEGLYDDGEGVRTLEFNRGMSVQKITPTDLDDDEVLSVTSADVLFVRPRVDAGFRINDTDMALKEVQVELVNGDGETKNVIIGATGYIFFE